jgi:hypothetical protein
MKNFTTFAIVKAYHRDVLNDRNTKFKDPKGEGSTHLNSLGFIIYDPFRHHGGCKGRTEPKVHTLLNHVNGRSTDLLPDMSRNYTIRILKPKDNMVSGSGLTYSWRGRGLDLLLLTYCLPLLNLKITY